MAKIFSLFRIFKRKKKNENTSRIVAKPSPSVVRPKQTITGLKLKPNSRFTSKTPQKLNENNFDVKTYIDSTRKVTLDERRIELVGNYFRFEDKQISEALPVRPQRKKSKNCLKPNKSEANVVKDCPKDKQLNPRDNRIRCQQILRRNEVNSSLDSIIEINNNRVLKEEEKIQKTSNPLKTNDEKREDSSHSIRAQDIEIHSNMSSKSNFDCDLGLNSSENSLHFLSDKWEDKSEVISGLVPIRDIDLKTAKCVVCLRLVSKNINLTICSHIFCSECLRQWLRYSQHCPKCRTFISSYGHSIRTKFNRICIRSQKDYKVMRISRKEDNFVDSLGAAYLFEAFLSNREISKFLDSNIATISAKIADLESKLSTKGSVQRNVNIRYKITQDNHKLEEFQKKKRQSEESFKEICGETNPQMLSFWKKVSILRRNPVLDKTVV